MFFFLIFVYLIRCQHRYICIQSSLAKVSSKKVNEKDVGKFQLYQNFSCNIRNIHHHQVNKNTASDSSNNDNTFIKNLDVLCQLFY